MAKSTLKSNKPYPPDSPMTPHRNGQWCKRIRGKLQYFGRLDDPDPALQEYLKVRDDLQAGRIPQRLSATTTLVDICSAFLTRCTERRDAGDISPRTFVDYYDVCKLLIRRLGNTTDPHHVTPNDLLVSATGWHADMLLLGCPSP